MQKNVQLTNAILQTLVYSDVFQSPLPINKLHKYLYKFQISQKDLEKYVSQLSFINKMGKYYVLLSRENSVADQGSRIIESNKKMKSARKIVSMLQYIPFIKLIGVSGSVSVQNADKNADIDLFIITGKNSLWISRLLVTVILIALGKKRMPGVKVSPDSVCTNMWVTDGNLKLSERTLFHAREFVQLKVLINKNNTFQKFYDANKWVKRSFPNFVPVQSTSSCREWNNFLIDAIDRFLFYFQKWYMQRKKTKERVSRQYAAFHPNDMAGPVMELYNRRLQVYKNMFGFSSKADQAEIHGMNQQDITYITPGS